MGAPDPLFSAEIIAAAVGRLAAEAAARIGPRETFVLPVMNGALYFAADLLRALPGTLPVVGYAAACVSSYGDGTSPGHAVVTAFPGRDRLEGRVALVVDTVFDTGATAALVRREARARGASDVLVCCLVEKPARRTTAEGPDLVALQAPDAFLVGYGLDAGGRFRTLPHIARLEAEPPTAQPKRTA